MIEILIRNSVRFLGLVLFQALILKNIELSGYIIPFAYVLFILALPNETPRTLVLGLGFLLGICMDFFYDTAGLHASACVLMAFFRPAILNLVAPRGGYETGFQPGIMQMGWASFLSYAGILIVIHHFLLFGLETFHLAAILKMLAKVVLSSIATLFFIVLIQFLFLRLPGKQ